MSASPPILTQFHGFAADGEIVGRLLTGYANLEVGLFNCVQVAIADFDKALKSMFGKRGESRRITNGEKLALASYAAVGLRRDFQAAVAAMRHCLDIRNQYAHWVWWNDRSGKLAFANLEDEANRKAKIKDLGKLKAHHVDTQLLTAQETYFAFVDQYLAWVNYEGRWRAKIISRNPLGKRPLRIKKPKLRLP